MKKIKAAAWLTAGLAAPALAHPGHAEDVAAGFAAGLLLAGLFIVAGGGVLLRRYLRRGDRREE
jgi:hypothetical protein